MCHGRRRDDEHGGAARALRPARRARRPPRRGRRAGPRTARAVAGEAGIGKTALVRAFCERARPGPGPVGRVRRALHPAPARPVRGHRRRGRRRARRGRRPRAPRRARSSRRCARSLRGRPPDIVVLEDLHWADEATLDVLRLLARRIESLPALVLATYRDDEIDPRHPLRIVLGELPSGSAARLALAPLSRAGRGRARRVVGVDHAELHRRTAGNPFYVTEVLAAGRRRDPRDRPRRRARPRRAARRAARALLDAVAIAPMRAELWLLSALADGELDGLDGCLASGDAAGRARRGELPPRDRAGRRRGGAGAPPAPGAAPQGARGARRRGARPDPARLAHHAEAADDAEAVLRYAPAAGERAAMLGSHREAAAQFARALRYGAGLPSDRRAELLERRSYECYLTHDIAGRHRGAPARARGAPRGGRHAPPGRRAPLAVAPGLVRGRQRNGRGRGAAGGRAARAARARARARDGLQQHGAAADAGQRPARRERLGRARLELAERLGETEIVVHALNNVGRGRVEPAMPAGPPSSNAASRWRSRPASRSTWPARTPTWARARCRCARTRSAIAISRPASRYCVEHDLDLVGRLHGRMAGALGARPGALGRRGRHGHGRAGGARHPGADAHHPAHGRSGRLRARRGDPDPWAPLDEALELARGTGEVQRLAPVAAARAGGALARRRERGDRGRDRRRRSRSSRPTAGPAASCTSGAGAPGIVEPSSATLVAEPFRLELAGD